MLRSGRRAGNALDIPPISSIYVLFLSLTERKAHDLDLTGRRSRASRFFGISAVNLPPPAANPSARAGGRLSRSAWAAGGPEGAHSDCNFCPLLPPSGRACVVRGVPVGGRCGCDGAAGQGLVAAQEARPGGGGLGSAETGREEGLRGATVPHRSRIAPPRQPPFPLSRVAASAAYRGSASIRGPILRYAPADAVATQDEGRVKAEFRDFPRPE